MPLLGGGTAEGRVVVGQVKEVSDQGAEVHHGELTELLPEAQCQPQAGSDYQSDTYEVTAGNMVAVARSPTSLEPKVDVGGSEQQHLLQIIDPKMPKGKRATGAVHSLDFVVPWVPQEGGMASGSLPGAGFSRAGHQGPRLAMPGTPPLILSHHVQPVSCFLYSLNAQVFSLFSLFSPA